jgi:hypothetical protein
MHISTPVQVFSAHPLGVEIFLSYFGPDDERYVNSIDFRPSSSGTWHCPLNTIQEIFRHFGLGEDGHVTPAVALWVYFAKISPLIVVRLSVAS